MTSSLDLSATTTAVLVVDMQNDNLHPEGAFAATGAADHATSQDVVRHVRTVLDAARAAGAAVFHNRIVAYPGRDVGGSNAPIFRMIGPDSLKVGTWGAAIVDGLDLRKDELVLDRVRMSAFSGTSLDVMLRNVGVTDVVVVGVWTNMAVEHTVAADADPAKGAGGDDIAGHESDCVGDVLDDRADGVDEVLGVADY